MDLEIVDAHQHFWDPEAADYPWMTEALAPIRRRFAPEDLRPELEQAGAQGSLLVQARSSRSETLDFLETAAQTDFVLGVIGWVDLVGDTAAEIAQLREAKGGRFLVGIRHQVHDEPDPDWLLQPAVRQGLRAVEEAGLVYDLLIRPRELPAASELARLYPGLPLVVDHIAKPSIAARETDPWSSLLEEIARCENVTCKLSGMTTEAAWDDWNVPQLQPYAEHVLRCFSPDRVMFGSDWPVCLLAGTYSETLAATRELVGFLSADERHAVFSKNAMRVYGLT